MCIRHRHLGVCCSILGGMTVRLVAVLLLAVSVGCLLLASRLQQIACTYCRESPAVVHSGGIYLGEDYDLPYVGYLFYSYEAASQTYYGTCTHSFLTPQDALLFLEAFAASRTVARYKAGSPNDSCLVHDFGQTETGSNFPS
jgi:hypothetical protein